LLKTIIKRNGQREKFNPDKANGWGEWGAKTLGGAVDWGAAVLHSASTQGEECTSDEFQDGLIAYCLDQNDDPHSRMAGRLYASQRSKQLYGKKKPTVQVLHQRLQEAGLMVKLRYTADEYEAAEGIINHSRDLRMRHYQIHQIRKKYALRNKITGDEFETPQFTYMRMAMALAEDMAGDRIEHVRYFYDFFSEFKLNPPTPNFTNLGTKLNGYVSCCLFESDDTADSLAAGDHIAYKMTCLSAGIGAKLRTRSIMDPVRGGLFPHQGKLPYYRAQKAMTGANLQNGRGGAETMHYDAFDPQVETIIVLRNPMTPADVKIGGMDYSFGSNKVFARAVANNQQYATFSRYHEPELEEAMYKADQTEFEQRYAEYLTRAPKAAFLPARDILVKAITQAFETGRHYRHNIDEMNRHTPFKDPIRLSNLCQEITEPTKPYVSVEQLYQPWDESHGEIALCSLAGVIVSNIRSDQEYAKVAEYALRMIDVCIHKTDYPFKSLEHTAKSRMNAGVGVLGLAHLLAKKGLKYDTQEGLNFIHELKETHYWHLVNASLKISKERGVASWMHRTKWPEGWLPVDTYNRNVDKLVTVGNKRDWEWLRPQIVANGGIGHSVLAADMPGESSTIAAGTTNGAYPVRDNDLNKTNDTNSVRWVAPDADKYEYQFAWSIHWRDMWSVYAVMQKWTDQSISADSYRDLRGDKKVGTDDIIQEWLFGHQYGIKTGYYLNSLTAKGVNLNYNVMEKPTVAPVVAEPAPDVELEAECENCAL